MVSIIIPAFNRLQYLGPAIRSAQLQSVQDTEIVVVDDSSEEDVRELVEREAALDGRIRYELQAPNAGQSAARHFGAKRSSGEFLQFLDSDDLLHPEKLHVQIQAFAEDPSLEFIVCQTQAFEIEPGDSVFLWNTFRGEHPLIRFCRRDLPWQIGALLVRRTTYDRIGGFWCGTRRYEDREFMLRLLANGCHYRELPHAMVFYRHHLAGQVSVVQGGVPNLQEGELYLRNLAALDANGFLTPELRRDIMTTICRMAHLAWRRGMDAEAARLLREAAEAGDGVVEAEAVVQLAERLPRFLPDGPDAFAKVKAAGFDWTIRPKWFRQHRAEDEGLLDFPRARRYGRASE